MNVPNKLTISRIVMSILIVIILLIKYLSMYSFNNKINWK